MSNTKAVKAAPPQMVEIYLPNGSALLTSVAGVGCQVWKAIAENIDDTEITNRLHTQGGWERLGKSFIEACGEEF